MPSEKQKGNVQTVTRLIIKSKKILVMASIIPSTIRYVYITKKEARNLMRSFVRTPDVLIPHEYFPDSDYLFIG